MNDAIKGFSSVESIAKKEKDKKIEDYKKKKAKQDTNLASIRKKNKEKRRGEYEV